MKNWYYRIRDALIDVFKSLISDEMQFLRFDVVFIISNFQSRERRCKSGLPDGFRPIRPISTLHTANPNFLRLQ